MNEKCIVIAHCLYAMCITQKPPFYSAMCRPYTQYDVAINQSPSVNQSKLIYLIIQRPSCKRIRHARCLSFKHRYFIEL